MVRVVKGAVPFLHPSFFSLGLETDAWVHVGHQLRKRGPKEKCSRDTLYMHKIRKRAQELRVHFTVFENKIPF